MVVVVSAIITMDRTLRRIEDELKVVVEAIITLQAHETVREEGLESAAQEINRRRRIWLERGRL